jgi:hypothetical protein
MEIHVVEECFRELRENYLAISHRVGTRRFGARVDFADASVICGMCCTILTGVVEKKVERSPDLDINLDYLAARGDALSSEINAEDPGSTVCLSRRSKKALSEIQLKINDLLLDPSISKYLVELGAEIRRNAKQ